MREPVSHLYQNFLLLRCQTGDESALCELIALYSPRLRFYLAKLTSVNSADDLLQDTWLSVYRHINQLEKPSAFPTWLYRIARDHAYRNLRRKHLVTASIDETFLDTIACDEEEFTAADAEHVREALDRLPLDQREILTLRFIEDMPYDQIAQVINIPVGTVRSRLHYAKVALRSKLEDGALSSASVRVCTPSAAKNF